MSSDDGSLDIDMFLVRLNKVIPNSVATWFAYMHPVVSTVSLMASILIIVVFRRQKAYSSVQRLLGYIVFLISISMLVRVPLYSMLFGNNDLYSDYLEYKWCEVFNRVSIDTPFVIGNVLGFLKVGLAVQGLIITFAPKKVNRWMSSRKTLWFCILASVTGILVYIPAMLLVEFIPVEWFSKINNRLDRQCCVAFPHEMAINVEYYQRNVYIGLLVTNAGFPILCMVLVGIILSIRLHQMKRINQSGDVETYQQKEVIRTIAVCLFTFAAMHLPFMTSTLLVTLLYAQVDTGVAIDTLQFILSYLNFSDTICLGILSPLILLILCCCDTNFRVTFLKIIRRRNSSTE